MLRPWIAIVLACGLVAPTVAQDDPVFSGPQVGERVVPFEVEGVYDELAGKKLDVVREAADGPLLLVFVHQFNRPSVGVSRALGEYAAKRKADGLHAAIIFLGADATAITNQLKRASHAMPDGVPIALSREGGEGPGAYGLNRNVTLTVLVANKGLVTANFALVQPSLQADVVPILAAVVKQVGGRTPTLAELGLERRRGDAPGQLSQELGGLVRSLLNKENSPDDVAQAAQRVADYLDKYPRQKAALGVVATRVVNGPRFDSYGTPAARKVLLQWAERFGPKMNPPARGDREQKKKQRRRGDGQRESNDDSSRKGGDGQPAV